jgi:hypothetical protein
VEAVVVVLVIVQILLAQAELVPEDFVLVPGLA